MIVYDLQCGSGHTFEGWFEDSAAFGRQQAEGLITCPICNDTRIVRIPSTFAIKGSAGSPPPVPENPQVEAKVLARAIGEYMEKNFDNVGPDFASEALKIHYGVCEPRNIRGVSTPHEEETLRQEGVSFFKLPNIGIEQDQPPDNDEQ